MTHSSVPSSESFDISASDVGMTKETCVGSRNSTAKSNNPRLPWY